MQNDLFLPSSLLLPHLAIGEFILFCRIGSCLMLAPGFSNSQVPVQARLFVALAITFSLSPLLLPDLPHAAVAGEPAATVQAILSELVIGAAIGLLSRIFLAALETLAVSMATSLGLSNVFGGQFDVGEALPPLASFISLCAVALIFVMNLHIEILKGLIQSYQAAPVAMRVPVAMSLRQIADALSVAFRVALQISSPFIIYALIVNFAISLINRLTPQIAIYYLSAPFVIAGGLFLLYFTIKASLFGFADDFSAWLSVR